MLDDNIKRYHQSPKQLKMRYKKSTVNGVALAWPGGIDTLTTTPFGR